MIWLSGLLDVRWCCLWLKVIASLSLSSQGGLIAVTVITGREDGTVPLSQMSVDAFEHTLHGTLIEVLVSAPAGRSERGESLPDLLFLARCLLSRAPSGLCPKQGR